MMRRVLRWYIRTTREREREMRWYIRERERDGEMLTSVTNAQSVTFDLSPHSVWALKYVFLPANYHRLRGHKRVIFWTFSSRAAGPKVVRSRDTRIARYRMAKNRPQK